MECKRVKSFIIFEHALVYHDHHRRVTPCTDALYIYLIEATMLQSFSDSFLGLTSTKRLKWGHTTAPNVRIEPANLRSRVRSVPNWAIGAPNANMSVQCTAYFTAVKMVIFGWKMWYFSYCCSKYRLWVHGRTASMRRFKRVPHDLCFRAKKKPPKKPVHPCKPALLKVRCKGVFITWTC